MQKWQRCILALIFLFALYQALRAVFFLNNPDIAQHASLEAITLAWLHGFRFDLSALAMINAIPFLIYSVPSFKSLEKLMRSLSLVVFVLLNSAFIIVNIVDIEYFQFAARRATINAFAMTTDLSNQFWQIAGYYWHYSLCLVATPIVVAYIAKKSFPHKPTKSRLIDFVSFGVLVLALAALARGGWQAKPLIPAHAFLVTPGPLALLSLNSSFTLIKSFDRNTPERLRFYPDWVSVKKELESANTREQLDRFKPLPQNTNVVVILLESFGLEYMGLDGKGPSFTPFLNQLAKRGRFFKNHFASGRRSIDAIPSIFASIPSWMSEAFITSQFQTNRIGGLGHSLQQRGYDTKFYHGGKPGTMFIDLMAQRTGFNTYLDAASFSGHKDAYDGHWGVFDEPFLGYVAKDLTKTPSPFLAGIFTLSSHHPYKIPAVYNGRFPKGELEIHESIGYADYALKRFFEKAEQTDWYTNTLFVITADHTSKTNSPYYQSELGRFRVPLIFFHPKEQLDFLDTDKIAQHTDIKPSIEHMLGIDSNRSLFGNSLARPQDNVAVLYTGNSYKAVTKDLTIDFRTPDRWMLFKRSDWQQKHPIVDKSSLKDIERYKRFVKAKVQAFQNGLLDDKLVW